MNYCQLQAVHLKTSQANNQCSALGVKSDVKTEKLISTRSAQELVKQEKCRGEQAYEKGLKFQFTLSTVTASVGQYSELM